MQRRELLIGSFASTVAAVVPAIAEPVTVKRFFEPRFEEELYKVTIARWHLFIRTGVVNYRDDRTFQEMFIPYPIFSARSIQQSVLLFHIWEPGPHNSERVIVPRVHGYVGLNDKLIATIRASYGADGKMVHGVRPGADPNADWKQYGHS